MATVEFRNVQKSFGAVQVIEDLNLSINDGEFVALLGPSGCGKSTSLFMLAGIYLPTGGDILFDGHRVNEVEARDRNVGIVFQSYALYPHLSVRDNIRFPLRFKKVTADDTEKRINDASELVQISDLLDRRPSQLSGGQQQRVALARALIKDPTLLLLDEPLSNLDATLRLSMRTEIKSLQERLGVTTVLVTHDQIEATTMADRIMCMRDGSIEQIGSADDLYLRPNSLFVASFIGSPPINLIQGNIDNGSLRIGDSTFDISDAEPGAVTVGLRPEHLDIRRAGLAGRITQIEPMGREILYVVDTSIGTVRVLEAGSIAERRVGEQVHLDGLKGQHARFHAQVRRPHDRRPVWYLAAAAALILPS